MLFIEWSWVLALKWRSLGELLPFDITWGREVLKLALPPQRLGPDTRPEHQDPVRHISQKKREKKERKKINKLNKKIKLLK